MVKSVEVLTPFVPDSRAESNVRRTTRPTALFHKPEHTPQLSSDLARELTQDAINAGLFDTSPFPLQPKRKSARVVGGFLLAGALLAACDINSSAGDLPDPEQGNLNQPDMDHLLPKDNMPLSLDIQKQVLTALRSYPSTPDNPNSTTGLLVTDPYDGSLHIATVDSDSGISILPADGENSKEALPLSKTPWQPLVGDQAFLLPAFDADQDHRHERIATPVVAVEDVDGKMVLVAIPPENEQSQNALWRTQNLMNNLHPGDVIVNADGTPLAMINDYESIGYHNGTESLLTVSFSFTPLSADKPPTTNSEISIQPNLTEHFERDGNLVDQTISDIREQYPLESDFPLKNKERGLLTLWGSVHNEMNKDYPAGPRVILPADYLYFLEELYTNPNQPQLIADAVNVFKNHPEDPQFTADREKAAAVLHELMDTIASNPDASITVNDSLHVTYAGESIVIPFPSSQSFK